MSSQKKHNKIKNTGILFELLTRQIAVDVMNDSKNSPAIKIIKEFFNDHTRTRDPDILPLKIGIHSNIISVD